MVEFLIICYIVYNALRCKVNAINITLNRGNIMTQVNFRVDDTIKAKAESACTAMGLSMSTAINIFLTKLANEQRIPFEVAVDPFYRDENMTRLRKSITQLNAGKGKVHEVDYE